MRELVLDTETTGMEDERDRLISLGIVELIDGKFANEWEWFFNPGIPCSPSAYNVHRVPDWWLAERFDFRAHADEIAGVLGLDDPMIAHNASFDRRFLNKEFRLLVGKTVLTEEENTRFPEARWIDTVKIARKQFPKQPNKLDDLADRFGIYRGHRIKHGALKDARILVEVYQNLKRGESKDLLQEVDETRLSKGVQRTMPDIDYAARAARKSNLSSAEKRLHTKFVETMGANAIWYDYIKPPKKFEKPDDKETA